MSQVLSALESLHINLPPSLATHQAKSLRKELRYHMLRMLKHPQTFSHYHQLLQQLLSDLGCNQQEISRFMPERREVNDAIQRRVALLRAAAQQNQASDKSFEAKPSTSAGSASVRPGGPVVGAPDTKRLKLDQDEYLDEGTAEILRGADANADLADASQRAVDITSQFVYERLSLNVVVKLVTISLFTLPAEMPAAFQSTFTNIGNAGSDEQKKYLSRSLAIQITKEGEGPGIKFIREDQQSQYLARQNARMEGAAIPPTPTYQMGQSTSKKIPKKEDEFAKPQLPKKNRVIQWDLLEITKELLVPEAQKLSLLAFQRIMDNELRATQGGALAHQHQLLVRLTSRYLSKTNDQFVEKFIEYIILDQKNRAELALLWLNELFIQYGGYSTIISNKGPLDVKEKFIRYDRALCSMLGLLYNRKDNKENLFHRILLEVPMITEAALTWLRKACLDVVYGAFGMITLREMILTRPRQRKQLLDLLLSFSYYEPLIGNPDRGGGAAIAHDVRENSVETAKELYMADFIRDDLREFVIEMSGKLVLPYAPKDLVVQCRRLSDEEALELPDETLWDETLIRAALHLFISLLPIDPTLLQQLASVTARATNEVKRVTFRSIEQAIKSIGMQSPELLQMIEDCPPGAEPLIARIVHLLTERNAPTVELVDRVRALHKERNTDVRSLIPILAGLDRDELLELVPKFVMNATNSKSVPAFFRKLIFGRHIRTHAPLMTPADLLIELHRCKPANIRENSHLVHNTDLLIVDQDRTYQLTKEVVASAIEDLIEEEPIPRLLFHSLQKIHEQHPSLKGFLANVLNKIATKHTNDEELKALMAKFTQTKDHQSLPPN